MLNGTIVQSQQIELCICLWWFPLGIWEGVLFLLWIERTRVRSILDCICCGYGRIQCTPVSDDGALGNLLYPIEWAMVLSPSPCWDLKLSIVVYLIVVLHWLLHRLMIRLYERFFFVSFSCLGMLAEQLYWMTSGSWWLGRLKHIFVVRLEQLIGNYHISSVLTVCQSW